MKLITAAILLIASAAGTSYATDLSPQARMLVATSTCRTAADCDPGEYCDESNLCESGANPGNCSDAGGVCFTSLDCCNPQASCLDSVCNR
jgi:hypothetical protein